MQQQFAVGQEVSKRDLKRVLPVIIYWKRSYTLSSFRSDHFHHVLFTKERKREFFLFYFHHSTRLSPSRPPRVSLFDHQHPNGGFRSRRNKETGQTSLRGGENFVYFSRSSTIAARWSLIKERERERKKRHILFRFGGRLNGFRICWPTHNTIWHTWPACVCV